MANNEHGKVRIKNVRLAFANLFTPRSFNDDPTLKPKYSCSFLIPKETVDGKETIAAVKAAMKTVYDDKWPKDGPKLKPNQICLRDGDDEEYEGFAGNMFVSASNERRPIVVDRDRSPLTEADDKVYSGCFVNATIRIWAQENDWGKRLNCSVEAVQFVSPGERVGAKAVNPDEEFEALDVGGSDEHPFG